MVGAEPRPVEGAEEIARFLVGRAGAVSGVTITECTVNGQPGLVARAGRVTGAAYAFDLAGDRITRIRAVLDPAKLRPWTMA
ncbi:hypothetical protein GCM10010182_10120 [Actinomadura cremea]|nr:hypothetical protein GCM10010182_10120 [Actinomadura cremea]